MMFWFLIVCVPSVNNSATVCLPLQRTASSHQCEFIAAQYRSMPGIVSASTRCIALSKDPTP